MRIDDIKVTFSIPIDRLGWNGTSFTKEDISRLNDGLPIKYIGEVDERIIGITESHNLDFDDKTGKEYLQINGRLFSGGTSEEIVLNKNNEAISMTIVNIGIH